MHIGPEVLRIASAIVMSEEHGSIAALLEKPNPYTGYRWFGLRNLPFTIN
jgi:hypothetical protein